MQSVIALFIFCIVLFLYLHIYFHLRTSDDLEVYEIYQPSKEKLEEICDLRQPVVFDYDHASNDSNSNFMTDIAFDVIKHNYGAFDVKIKNMKDSSSESEPYMPLTLNATHEIMKADTGSQFISEKNADFLDETGVVKQFHYNDDFLRPPLVSNCDYDYMFASEGAETVLQHSVRYRNYFFLISGRAKIILIPPKSSKYLYARTDYESFEFVSPVSPWNVQHMYKADYDKIKTLDVVLTPGKIIFIPAYWWYSIKFYDGATICAFKYRTYMNTVAILPHIFLHFLQRQNVKRSTVKRLDADNASTTSRSASAIGTGTGTGETNEYSKIASTQMAADPLPPLQQPPLQQPTPEEFALAETGTRLVSMSGSVVEYDGGRTSTDMQTLD